MHETSLAMGILRIALEEAQKYTVTCITDIRLALGLLACVEEQTLSQCFSLVAVGTLAENAHLHVERQSLACTCSQCDMVFTLQERKFFCPQCGAKALTFTGGHGCTIVGIDVKK